MDVAKFCEEFLGADSVEVVGEETVRLTFRGVSRANFKEFFTATLTTEDVEENLRRIGAAIEEVAEHERSDWEDRLRDE